MFALKGENIQGSVLVQCNSTFVFGKRRQKILKKNNKKLTFDEVSLKDTHGSKHLASVAAFLSFP